MQPKQETCKHGHPFTPENIHWYPTKSGRLKSKCRACDRDRKKKKNVTLKVERQGELKPQLEHYQPHAMLMLASVVFHFAKGDYTYREYQELTF